MSAKKYDVVVVGLGIQGMSTCVQLARRGLRVLGVDQYAPGNPFSASWGDTRLIRKSYFEDVRYLPLLENAYHSWYELQTESKLTLLNLCGFLIFGNQKNNVAYDAIFNAQGPFNQILKPLSIVQCRKRFPMFQLPSFFSAAYEKNAGFLDVEKVFSALLQSGESLGVTFCTEDEVLRIDENGDMPKVCTANRTFTAEKIVITVGAWLKKLIPDFPMTLRVKPAPQFWFKGADAQWNQAPCFALASAENLIYGFPNRASFGIKIAQYHPIDLEINPNEKNQLSSPWPLAPTVAMLQNHLPTIEPEPVRWGMCMYHLSHDEHFIIDQVPNHENIIVATGCSGHAFKFGPAIGDLVWSLLDTGNLVKPFQFLKIRAD